MAHPRSDLDFSRQRGIFRPEQSQSPISLIGAGGSGSWIALSLAKMGVQEIEVHDEDVVTAANLRSTVYGREHLGMKKVDALQQVARSVADGQVRPVSERFVFDHHRWHHPSLHPIVISAVDSMDARRELWLRIERQPEFDLYIDTRMGGNICQIHCVLTRDRADAKRYGKFLYPSPGKAATKCGETHIVGCTAFIGSVVASIVRTWWLEGVVPMLVTVDLNTLQYSVVHREQKRVPRDAPEAFEMRLHHEEESITIDDLLAKHGMTRLMLMTHQCTVDGVPTINPRQRIPKGAKVILSPQYGR